MNRSLLLIVAIAVLFCFSCESQRKLSKSKINNYSSKKQDSVKDHTVVKKVDDQGYKKVINYPYLTIRFQQEDTEVEMVIDPLVTNLQLDLKRKPGSTIEITPDPTGEKADSTDVDLQDKISTDDLLTKDFNSTNKNLTDEILADLTNAQTFYYKGEYKKALAILQKSIEKKPTASAYAIGGSIYYVNGDIEKATKAWEMALKLNPEMHEIREMMATIK